MKPSRVASLVSRTTADVWLVVAASREVLEWFIDSSLPAFAIFGRILELNIPAVAPGSDSGDPTGRAISCDVFQLVDLRPLRHALSPDGDSVLELSADFHDGRAPNSKPSVSFFGQLYLFAGDPSSLHQTWPQSIPEALASGSAQATTLGSDAKGTRTLIAKCLIPAQADFAVIQIAARPNLRPAKLDGLSADNVKLTLKTQPTLPVRIVHR